MNISKHSVDAYWDELEKIARAETHKALEAKAEPGDIIHVGMARRRHSKWSPAGWAESLFRGASKSIQGSMTHSAMYVGKDKIVEARLGEGVKIKSFKEALKGRDYMILRPKTTKRKRRAAARFAKSQVGKDYDSIALIQTGAGKLLPNWTTNLIDRGRLKPPENSKAFTCSNLLSAAYRKAGADLGGSFAAPVDFRMSDKTETIGKRIRKGFEETAPVLSPFGAQKIRKMQKQEGSFVTQHPLASASVIGAGIGGIGVGTYLLRNKAPFKSLLKRFR